MSLIMKNNLRLLMAKKGIRSLTELERQSGVTRQVLDRIDKEKARRLDYDTIEKLCNYFECGIGDLLYLEEDKQKEGGEK